MTDPTYPPGAQDAVNDMCIAISRAEIDLEKAMISCGALPAALQAFRTAIGRSLFMSGNDVKNAGSGTETVTSFYQEAGQALLDEGVAMDDLRLLHCELEAFRIRCNLPPPTLASAGGGKG